MQFYAGIGGFIVDGVFSRQGTMAGREFEFFKVAMVPNAAVTRL